jgi:hypothetical protein
MKYDEIAEGYIQLRDAKSELEKKHEAELAPIKSAMEEAEQVMLGQLNEMGVNSLRTQHGTISKVKKTSVTVGNWDAAWQFIQEKELFHFLEHRLNKTAVEGYINEHGEPPPGANVSSIYTVQFRRS